VVAEVGDPARCDEIVFFGFGEPLLRIAEVKEIAGVLKPHAQRKSLAKVFEVNVYIRTRPGGPVGNTHRGLIFRG